MDDAGALLVARPEGMVCSPGRAMDESTVDFDRIDALLADVWVDPEVFALCPDYRLMLVAVDGLAPDDDEEHGETMLQAAEASARGALRDGPPEQLPHLAAWRGAHRAVGAKPKRYRNSVEALLRRAESGLPRINRLTDIYNAISVLHQIPLGGEDLTQLVGPLRLVRATGEEPFDTEVDGDTVIEYPAPGEVVRCDDLGVTCRRWNWRQGRRTRLHEGSTSALFILDALEPISSEALRDAVDDLIHQLRRLGPSVRVAERLITAELAA
jgi:DNA/RNA-binding domain of Phe-tRNA-synthetase-like protein